MLVIKHKYHFELPRLGLSISKAMELSPVLADDDSLVRSIENDRVVSDSNWTLSERPDNDDLVRFWQRVVDETQTDPEWAGFPAD